MATRRLAFGDWLRLVRRHALDNEFPNVAGFPPGEVATKLDVSHQRVSQLVADGTLDLIEIVNKNGKVSLTLVTEASLDRYLATRVTDRGRQGYFAFQT